MMPNDYLGGSAASRIWKRMQDSFASLLEKVNGKQDKISDLDAIRSGAASGATALQEVPFATGDTIGGAKVAATYGLSNYGDYLCIARAQDSDVAGGANVWKPLVSANIDGIVRRGLCNGNAIYTDAEQAAARERIGVDRTMRLLSATTLTEDSYGIRFDADSSGNPYNIKRAIVVLRLKNIAAQGYICAAVNTDKIVYSDPNALVRRETGGTPASKVMLFDIICADGAIRASCSEGIGNDNMSPNGSNAIMAPTFVLGGAINSVAISAYTGNQPIHEGSIIEIYGA